MKKLAIIFDVDGVLLDTVPYHFSAWKKLFKKQAVSFTFGDYLQKVNGLPRITGVTNMFKGISQSKADVLGDMKQQYFLDMVAKNPPKPLEGVIEFLQYLKKKNVKLAAASSSKNAPHLLKNLGISDYFTVIISGSDFTKPKPDPQIFTLTADKLKVPYKHVVVIEDAYHGALAGKKAGMRVIGLMTSNDEKLYTISDFVTDSLKNYQEVIEFLKI